MEFEDFEDLVEEIYVLEDASSVLSWDQEVTMPEGGIKPRKGQKKVLTGIRHQKLSSKELGNAIEELEDQKLSSRQESILREVKRRHERISKVPEDLHTKISEKGTNNVEVWRKAREEDDFEVFEDDLAEMVGLKRRLAEEIDPDKEPYQVLFEDYEPYLDFETVERVMKRLKKELPEIIDRIEDEGDEIGSEALEVSLSNEENMDLAERTAEAIGFDFDRGRIDTSSHPFTTGNQFDTRITTRFKDDSVAENVAITMHETGHALYNLGVPQEEYGNPLGSPRELVVHESQSRLWENHVGRSREFWSYYSGKMSDISDKMSGIDPEDAYRSVNAVEFDNKIRTEADELTYHLHIALRFELGRKLINGDLEVSELPEEWNRRMEDLLGVEVESAAEGILQDIHWGWGSFGYFPTYSLGSVLAAQLFDAAEADIDGLDDKIASGEFEPLLDWLRDNIHSKGQRETTPELIKSVTGQELSTEPFLEYARSKYSGLYGVGL